MHSHARAEAKQEAGSPAASLDDRRKARRGLGHARTAAAIAGGGGLFPPTRKRQAWERREQARLAQLRPGATAVRRVTRRRGAHRWPAAVGSCGASVWGALGFAAAAITIGD
ncbi:hypothetical protein U1Q18_045000 [Sarracenia purpurea var. burkii]